MYASDTDKGCPRKETTEKEIMKAVSPMEDCSTPHPGEDSAAIMLIERALSGISQ